MDARERAEQLTVEAMALEEAGKLEAAIARYEQAAAVDPTWSSPLFNLRLLFETPGDLAEFSLTLTQDGKTITSAIRTVSDAAYHNDLKLKCSWQLRI